MLTKKTTNKKQHSLPRPAYVKLHTGVSPQWNTLFPNPFAKHRMFSTQNRLTDITLWIYTAHSEYTSHWIYITLWIYTPHSQYIHHTLNDTLNIYTTLWISTSQSKPRFAAPYLLRCRKPVLGVCIIIQVPLIFSPFCVCVCVCVRVCG